MSAVKIAVTNQKGGVGKTTTAVNVAFYLAKMGKKVLLIDFDPQGNATSGLGIGKGGIKKSIVNVMDGSITLKDAVNKTKFRNLFLVPATQELANAEPGLASRKDRFIHLARAIMTIEKDYDFIIIDAPPSLGLLTINSLVAVKYVLLPVQAEFYALEGLGQLLETMKLTQKLNPSLELLGVLVTMVDGRTTLASQVCEEIKKHFPGKVFNTTIPRNVRLAEAPSHGLPVGAYDALSKGARTYKAVTKEIIGRIK